MTLTESYWPAEDIGEPIEDLTVGGLLRRVATEVPDRTALVAGVFEPSERRRWTYSELLADAETVAKALLERFEPGEKVAIWAPNIAEWTLLEFGAGLAGVTLVTVNPAFQSQEVDYVLRQSKSSGVFLLPEFRGNNMWATLEEVRPDLPELREAIRLDEWDDFVASADPARALPDVGALDPAQIQYTSGTTGFPKGALLHHRGIVNNARLTVERLGVADGCAYLNPMPMFHTGGCVIGALGSTCLRGAHVCVLMFDPGLALELAEQEQAAVMLGVPTMLIAMMEHPDFATRDLSKLQRVISGGSLVPADLVRRIEDTLGVTFSIVYGQTEASPVVTMTKPDDTFDQRSLTIGPPIPHTEVKIADPETGETVRTGVVGELCTRGFLVMHEYFELPDETAEAIDDDGWLHTGDLCAMDEDGYCTVEGRLKDMIIRGGENIYPKELEELLFEHPAVAEIAVVGLPDEKWGETVGAFVRPTEPGAATPTELFSYCRGHLAPTKTPTSWVFLDEFPLTASGKIQKFVLKENFEKGLYADQVDSGRT